MHIKIKLFYNCHITIALTSVKFGLSNATCEPHNYIFAQWKLQITSKKSK
jgi:hypothetical protein